MFRTGILAIITLVIPLRLAGAEDAPPALRCFRLLLPKAATWQYIHHKHKDTRSKDANIDLCLAWDPEAGKWLHAFGQSAPLIGKNGKERVNAATYTLDCSKLTLSDDALSGSVGITIPRERTRTGGGVVGDGWSGTIALSAQKTDQGWAGTYQSSLPQGEAKGQAIITEQAPFDPMADLQLSMVLEEALGPVPAHSGNPLRALLDIHMNQGAFVSAQAHTRYGGHKEHRVQSADLAFDGHRLQGTIILQTTGHPHYTGCYTLVIDCQVIGAVFSGTLQGSRIRLNKDGSPKPAEEYPGHASGIILPAESCTDGKWWSLASEPRRRT